MNNMITISFKTYLYKFLIKFQCSRNDIFKINKNYISIAATISSVKCDVSQKYGTGTAYVCLLIVNEMKAEDKS